jgi:hypothetical protein
MTLPRLACLPPLAVAGMVLSLSCAGALAQGTEEERRACTPDVMRLCREFIPSVSAITQCLIDKRAELNPDCKLVMTPKPQPVQQATAKPRTGAKRAPAAKRTATDAAPTAVARAAEMEPGEVIRPPLNIVPPAAATKPAKKRTRPAATAANSAAPAAAKKPPPKPQ